MTRFNLIDVDRSSTISGGGLDFRIRNFSFYSHQFITRARVSSATFGPKPEEEVCYVHPSRELPVEGHL